ncbi:hypothetical protein FD755_025217 [Muntiacus reevesi]|uniref:40S ribosomal protein S4 n=1 Tax=Muntiacus reevesi TaxID=9886 RepID=A0A5N3UPR9_MUNRE|nr:hypothetical protein FD755_025217 [Muntiacus reevesi]
MAWGPKKPLKCVAAPKHWMLDKRTGVFAPRPSTSPRKLREYEVKKICMQHFIKIDGKVRTDITYPAGFMDVISTDKIGENFHLIYDTKGRFAVHHITPEEAKYKLCKVRKIFVGTKGIPYLVNDTIQIDMETGKITDFIKFDTGANLGRIGVITNRERHPGSFDVVHVKDVNGNSFATWLSNIFVLAKATNRGSLFPMERVLALPLPKRDKRLAAKQRSG